MSFCFAFSFPHLGAPPWLNGDKKPVYSHGKVGLFMNHDVSLASPASRRPVLVGAPSKLNFANSN